MNSRLQILFLRKPVLPGQANISGAYGASFSLTGDRFAVVLHTADSRKVRRCP